MPSTGLPALETWLTRADARPAGWLVLMAVLSAAQTSTLWYATPDALNYLSIARSIAAGGEWRRLGDAQLGYPLGYPLLISPVFWTGAPLRSLSVLHWLMAVAFMLGVYKWARAQLDAGALWATALVMANVNVWILYRRALSECAFLVVMIWLVNLANRVFAEPDTEPRLRRWRLLATGLLLILLTAIREAGALFGVAFMLMALGQARRGAMRWRTTLAPLLVAGAAIALAAVTLPAERLAAAGPAFSGNLAGYADATSAVDTAPLTRLHLRMSEIGQLVVPGMFKAYGERWLDINTPVYALLLAAVCCGWWKLARRGGDVYTVAAPLYLGLHLAWPYAAGPRYMLPLLPLLVVCLLSLVASPPRRAMLAAGAAILHGGVALGYWLAVDRPRAVDCQRAVATLAPFVAAIDPADAARGAAALPPCVRLGVELALDRRVVALRAGVAPDPATGWLVSDDAAFAASGFSLRARAGEYALFMRARPPADGMDR
jgi:hypothetical protein